MSIKIEIQSVAVHEKKGTSAKTGKPYCIREQEAWAYTCDRDNKPHLHPERITLSLADDSAPYAVGTYVLALSSIYKDRFNNLSLGRPVLVPASAPSAVQKVA